MVYRLYGLAYLCQVFWGLLLFIQVIKEANVWLGQRPPSMLSEALLSWKPAMDGEEGTA